MVQLLTLTWAVCSEPGIHGERIRKFQVKAYSTLAAARTLGDRPIKDRQIKVSSILGITSMHLYDGSYAHGRTDSTYKKTQVGDANYLAAT